VVDEGEEEFSPSELDDLALSVEGLAERIERIAGRLEAS
jgi:cell division protein ZapA